jgi:hypothetical protein
MNDLRRVRFAEHIPAAPAADARRLRGLPSSWTRPIVESAIDALSRRAEGVARALSLQGNLRAAANLRRDGELLARADALHTHALRVETLAQLYRALVALSVEVATESSAEGALDDESMTWVQAGALPTADLSPAHGPAFRETASLRNCAFRCLEAAVARHARALGVSRG